MFRYEIFRSSSPKVFFWEAILQVSSTFTGDHPCRCVITLLHGCLSINLPHLRIFLNLFLRIALCWPIAASVKNEINENNNKKWKIIKIKNKNKFKNENEINNKNENRIKKTNRGPKLPLKKIKNN